MTCTVNAIFVTTIAEWIWDAEKARANLEKHGSSFEAAVEVFDDAMLLREPDPHLDGDRWRVIGKVWVTTLFVVLTIFDQEDGGLIISARRATASERKRYDDGYS